MTIDLATLTAAMRANSHHSCTADTCEVVRVLDALDQAKSQVRHLRAELDTALNQTWDASCAPGGYVCRTCGVPVESEPCADHAPRLPRVSIGDVFRAGGDL